MAEDFVLLVFKLLVQVMKIYVSLCCSLLLLAAGEIWSITSPAVLSCFKKHILISSTVLLL